MPSTFKSTLAALLCLASGVGAAGAGVLRVEEYAFPLKTEITAAGSYSADTVGRDFVLSGAIEGDVSIAAGEFCRVTLAAGSSLAGTLSIDGDAAIWAAGGSIAADGASAVSGTGTLVLCGDGAASYSGGAAKVGVVSAATVLVEGGTHAITLATDAKNAYGVYVSSAYDQLAGTVSIVSTASAKQVGVSGPKKSACTLEGGLLDISMAGEKACGINLDKASCTTTLSGGVLKLAMGGDGAKGVKTDGTFAMTGGILDATITGGYVEELLEYEDDDDVTWNYYVTLTSSTKTSGGTQTYSTTSLINSGTYAVYDPSKAYAVKGGTVAISGGTVRIRCTGAAGRGLGADDMALSGGYYDISVAGGPTDVYVESLVEADDLTSNNFSSVTTCLDSGGAACLKTSGSDSTLTITGGTFLLSATGTAGKIINAAGSLVIGAEGASTLPTDASFSPDIQGTTTGSKTYCCAYKQKYYGSLATAAATTNIAALTLSTASDNIVGSSGGMSDDADYSNPKGVKGETGVAMHSGRLRIHTANDGGEGLESKAEMTITGGVLELNCADDCVNTASNLVVNGGYIYAASSGNDAFDSNADITINGGWLYAFTLASPEEAFDVNSGHSVTINGGCVFGIGNSQSGREGTISGTQKYYQGSYSIGTSATWLKASGTDTVYGKIPAASSSASGYLFCSVPGMSSGTAPTSSGTSAPSDANSVGFHGFYTTGEVETGGDDDELWSTTEPYSASYTTADSLWFNTEASASAVTVRLWYSADSGSNWSSADMTVNSEWTSDNGGCWWHVEIPASELQEGTFYYAVSVYDADGNEYGDNNGGSNYSVTISAASGGDDDDDDELWSATSHYSASYTTADSLWFNTEASTSAVTVRLWYSADSGANWSSADMTVNSDWNSETGCWWHVEIPASDLQEGTFYYAVSVYDADGNEYGDNNGGSNYSVTISAASSGDDGTEYISSDFETDATLAYTYQISSASSKSLTYAAGYLADGDGTYVMSNATITVDASNTIGLLAANGAQVRLVNCTIVKSGDGDTSSVSTSSVRAPGGESGGGNSDDAFNFYGINNAVVALGSGTTIVLDGCTVTTSGEYANAVFASDEGTVEIENGISITTTADASRGLFASYGGTVAAPDGGVSVSTSGSHCAGLVTDRGGGTIVCGNSADAAASTVSTVKNDSPCVYSTGSVTAWNTTGTCTSGQAVVVEGKNEAVLVGCTMTGGRTSQGCIFLYQSSSGDAADSDASNTASTLYATNCTFTAANSADMFVVTHTTAQVVADGCTYYADSAQSAFAASASASQLLINCYTVDSSQWGSGNYLTFTTGDDLAGTVCAGDSTDTLAIACGSGSTLATAGGSTGTVTITH